ncbi:MAG: dapB [Herbinix sp.]|nr:dapB [Herbinix sp.]
MKRKIGIVLCTTGFSKDQLTLIEEASKIIPLFKSANMSVGVNLISKLLKEAAVVLTDAGFDIEIVEKHHNKKVDAPSGTALALADVMNEALNHEYDYKYDRSQERTPRNKKEIGISAVRGGTIVGEHEVIFAGMDEVIEIKHTAYSKAIFAKGAIQAAKFLPGKAAGMYSMSDLMD